MTLGGTAGGLQTAIQDDLGGYRTRLDDFVTAMIDQLNTVHATGFTTDGSARAASVRPRSTDGSACSSPTRRAGGVGLGAAARWGRPSPTSSPSFARLDQRLVPRGRSPTSSNSVATLGRSVDTASAIADGAVDVRDSIVGVNMDEELTNMISQQRAYEAAARVITIVDEMMQTLLHDVITMSPVQRPTFIEFPPPGAASA